MRNSMNAFSAAQYRCHTSISLSGIAYFTFFTFLSAYAQGGPRHFRHLGTKPMNSIVSMGFKA